MQHKLTYIGTDCYRCDNCGEVLTREEVSEGQATCSAPSSETLVKDFKALKARVTAVESAIEEIKVKESV